MSSLFQASTEEYVSFDSNQFLDGAPCSYYMPSSHSRIQSSWSHASREVINGLISPLPNNWMQSSYHSLQYNQDDSQADKRSAGSNHTTHKKNHTSYRYCPSVASRWSAKKKKKADLLSNSISNTVLPNKTTEAYLLRNSVDTVLQSNSVHTDIVLSNKKINICIFGILSSSTGISSLLQLVISMCWQSEVLQKNSQKNLSTRIEVCES